MAKGVRPSDLTPRQGKVLRFIVSHTKLYKGSAITPEMCIVLTTWSDLPHNKTQAVSTISALAKRGLIVRSTTQQGYVPTDAGIKLMAAADKKGMWNAPPSPAKTNPKPRSK
jgi:hypothetical protein